MLISEDNPIFSSIAFKGKKNNKFATHKDRKSKIIHAPNIIISDFRSDAGEVADIVSFLKEFLGRTIGDAQKEAYQAIWGKNGGEWSREYSEIILEIGMKGGKNYWAEGDVCYTCYFLKMLKNPHDYFTKITKSLLPYTYDKNFDIVNVSSVDENQARRAFFEATKSVLKLTKEPKTGENWFEKYAGLDLREQFGDFGKKEIVFPTKVDGHGTIRLLSFNSTAKAPEGMHILKFYADELSRADTKAKFKEASKLYDLGLNNTAVSFPNRVGKTIGWSYPNDTDWDLTHARYLKSLEDSSIYGRKLATWDFNPSRTREMFDDQFRKDPIKANRIYGCIKPTSKENWFQPYVSKIKDAVNPQVQNRVTYKLTVLKRTVNSGKEYEFTSLELLSLIGDNRVRCFTADNSKTKDRFVIIGGYNETIEPFNMEFFIGDEGKIITTNVKPTIDIMIVIEPSDGKPVDYLKIGDIYSALIKAFPRTYSINSDHYQNEKLRQEVLAQGVNAETYFFSNSKQVQLYTYLRANVWNNNISVCLDHHEFLINNRQMNLSDLFVFEAETITHEGGKIDHPEWSSKDVLDGIAICNYDLMNLEAVGDIEDIDLLSEEELDKRLRIYMKEKETLVHMQEMEIEEAHKLIAGRMNIREKDVLKLAQFAKERYNY